MAKKKKSKSAKIGGLTFIIGVVAAVILGIISQIPQVQSVIPTLFAILVLAGIVVGFLNITDKETKNFVLMSVSLIIISYFMTAILSDLARGAQNIIVQQSIGALANIFTAAIVFVTPTTVVVALKEIYSMAKDA